MSASAEQLAFLLDCDDLACLEASGQFPTPEGWGTLIAADVDVHLRLLERGIAHLTPWDIVRPDEYAALCALDRRVLAFWDDSARADFDGIDCLRLARYRHMCCFARLAWAGYLIRRTLETLRPREVITFEETAGHGLDQPAGYRQMPLLFCLVRGMAEQAGIPVRLLHRAGPEAGFRDQVAAAAGLQLPPVQPDEHLRDRPYVLFAGSGLDLLRQLPVIRELRRRSGLEVVQIYKSAEVATLEALRAEGHTLWHESQVNQVRSAAGHGTSRTRARECGVRSECREARGEFDRLRALAPAELRGFFANPYLDMHFDFIFGEYLERMAEHVRTWTEFFARHRPAVLVANYPAPIVDVAHFLDIPCLVLSHGLMVLGDTRLYLGQPAVNIGAVSEAHRTRLIDAGIESGRVHVTGDPGADELQTRSAASGQSPTPKGWGTRLSTQSSVLGTQSSDARRILLVTGELSAPSAKACLPETDFAGAVRAFNELAELIGRRGDWSFAAKCHPRYDHPAIYERMNRRLPPERKLTIFTAEPVAALAREADAIVVPNARSSALLEASLCGRPVLILDTSMIWFDHALWGTDAWPRVRCVRDLEKELDRIFNDPQRLIVVTRRTAEAVRSCLGPPTPAAPRCTNLIERLSEEGHRSKSKCALLTVGSGTGA